VRTETRHQLKQDKFAETVGKQYSWAVDHRSILIYVGIILAVVAAAILGGMAYYNSRDAKASIALIKAMDIYNAPLRPAGMPPQAEQLSFTSADERARAAHGEFQKVADEYPHTNSGAIARYFSGLTAKDMNDMPAAEKELKQAADAGGKDLSALAKLALAGVYAQTNQESQAVELYKYLENHPTNSVGKFTAELQLAQLYQAKQPQEAAKLYQQIQKDDPTGAAGQIAAKNLSGTK
jgi:predicted negative regulator of RcsB-dependent stress response